MSSFYLLVARRKCERNLVGIIYSWLLKHCVYASPTDFPAERKNSHLFGFCCWKCISIHIICWCYVCAHFQILSFRCSFLHYHKTGFLPNLSLSHFSSLICCALQQLKSAIATAAATAPPRRIRRKKVISFAKLYIFLKKKKNLFIAFAGTVVVVVVGAVAKEIQ